MTYLVRWGLFCWLAVGSALAQVSVEAYFEHEQYLSGEPLQVGVRIVNFSGETLKLGDTPDWLDLLIESDQGEPVPQQAAPPIVEPFEVPSAARASAGCSSERAMPSRRNSATGGTGETSYRPTTVRLIVG